MIFALRTQPLPPPPPDSACGPLAAAGGAQAAPRASSLAGGPGGLGSTVRVRFVRRAWAVSEKTVLPHARPPRLVATE